MKAAIILLFMSCSLSAQIDTIYTEITPVKAKKTTIKVITTNGEEVNEKREVIDYAKAVRKIEALTRDTAMYTENIRNLREMERNIEAEKKRIRMMRRDAVEVIDRLSKILNNLK